MRRVVALLAAVLSLSLPACGEGGAEPGASSEATLVLDFTPNAVHSGLYAAQERGWFADEGLDLKIRPPGDSTDAPKLLAAGRTDFAVMDINDLGVAAARGFDLTAIGALVQVPLAAVIAADGDEIRRPRDLEGDQVGVTGLPSDDSVLEAIVEADGGDPDTIDRVVIGFDAVGALSGGELDAATAFWNAEGVALRELGVPTREFRIGDFAAKPFPELVVVTTDELAEDEPELVEAVQAGLERGYGLAAEGPDEALNDLLGAVDGTERLTQEAQMEALTEADAFSAGAEPGTLDPERYTNWERFARSNGIAAP
ncbi:MAG TPA: ABC transporter substrate-binding protein [Solirubrobacterales bacterium]|nr:ABC transporter substrate-binding protein [Solirubrobacterales bacterium]